MTAPTVFTHSLSIALLSVILFPSLIVSRQAATTRHEDVLTRPAATGDKPLSAFLAFQVALQSRKFEKDQSNLAATT